MRLALLLLLPSLAFAQSTQDAAPFTARMEAAVTRAANGHSPTAEEIEAVQTIDPLPDAAGVRASLPALGKALDSSDTAVRTYVLTALAGLASGHDPAATGQPISFKAETGAALAPLAPKIATHLTEDSRVNRVLTAQVLGGFGPDAPDSVYAPLLAFLRRDDAVGVVGTTVVTDLLGFGRFVEPVASSLVRYLHRSDQTAESRANLVDAIATGPYQNATVNQALLGYLDSDDNALRARVILSLPQLELTPEAFADTKARIATIAEGSQDALQVVTAAKAVSTCWTAVHMTSGCPVY